MKLAVCVRSFARPIGECLIAQLSSSDPNLPCYEETFSQANVIKNEAKQFKARTP